MFRHDCNRYKEVVTCTVNADTANADSSRWVVLP